MLSAQQTISNLTESSAQSARHNTGVRVAPFAGAWIDNARHVRVMVIADIVCVPTTAVFITVGVCGGLTPWQTVSGVSPLLLINANAAQFFNPARACIMQVAIPYERRMEASAKAMFSMTGAGILIFSSVLRPSLVV